METIFDYDSYRTYLKKRLGDGQRLGIKKLAANALGVHTTLISQILSGKCEISLEQTENMNLFLGHSEDEADFFLLQVLKERAGTASLRRRLEKQIDIQKAKRLNLSMRVKDRSEITESEKEKFYSNSLYAAIHVLTSIPGFQSKKELANSLNIASSKVSEAVDFLVGLGVVTETKGHLSPGQQHIHLGSDSKHIYRHHLNWRLKAIERISEQADRDLHYSVIFSLSEDDVKKIKEIILSTVGEVSKVVNKSKEETAYVFCFDFFELPQLVKNN